MNKPENIQTFSISHDTPQKGLRIDQALVQLLPDYSRTQIKSWIEQGHVLVNGEKVSAKNKIKGGETISVQVVLKSSADWEPQAIPLQIVYEDASLLVINKPPGLIVHPGAGNPSGTLLNALIHYCPSLTALPRAGIIHRLDKDTSGLLLIAKTPKSYKRLCHQLKKRIVSRTYKAIVNGVLISGGSVHAPIGRHPLNRKRMAVLETGNPASTHYRIDQKYRAHTLLTVQLETGRTHQIRVHMSHIHHPIIGDKTYGGRQRLASKGMSNELAHALRQFPRQALHAFALGCYHPETEEWMQWESPLPDDMKELTIILKKDLETS